MLVPEIKFDTPGDFNDVQDEFEAYPAYALQYSRPPRVVQAISENCLAFLR